MSNDPIGFLGGGNMATAIIAGLQGSTPAPPITVVDPVPAIQDRHAASGCRSGADPVILAGCPTVVLAVKPQVAEAALRSLAPHLGPGCLVVSIMAGLTCSRLQDWLPSGVSIVRSMPNTPLAIGAGMVVLVAGPGAGPGEMDRAAALFTGSGSVLRLDDEDLMDAVTAVSGSGPAFLFRLAEAQVAAACGLGLERSAAEQLVVETLHGSIAYLRSQEGFAATRLREQVTSPGGTTAAGLAEMDAAAPETLFARIYRAARDRSCDLSAP